MNVTIEYDGKFPNLCRGNLVVTVDGKRYAFSPYCLSSGGSVLFDDEWNEEVNEGPWNISEWPSDFPDEYKQAVVDAVNESIPHGCCGGCV